MPAFVMGAACMEESAAFMGTLPSSILCLMYQVMWGVQGVTISNDGATIMKLLEIVHPAAKTLADISLSQDAEVSPCLSPIFGRTCRQGWTGPAKP